MDSNDLKISLYQTWPEVAGNPNTRGWFFQRLFEMAPKVKSILNFAGQVQSSDCVLTFILTHLADLESPELIKNELKDHTFHKNLTPECYSYIKKALILTIHDIIGPKFNSTVRDAWDTALNEMIVILIEAGNDVLEFHYKTA